jgi:HSP20 family protein
VTSPSFGGVRITGTFPNRKEHVMSNLTRFDPFRDLMRGSFGDLWPEFGSRWPAALRAAEGMPGEIRLDVAEAADAYTVKAEIPGAKKEEIHVRVEGATVAIGAEHQSVREEKEGERVLLRERVQGSVARSFTLAHEVDESAVSAKLEDGVLTLVLPKRRGGASRRIEIQ